MQPAPPHASFTQLQRAPDENEQREPTNAASHASPDVGAEAGQIVAAVGLQDEGPAPLLHVPLKHTR